MEADGALWLNLHRKLLAAGTLQWCGCLRLSSLGGFSLADMEGHAAVVLAVGAVLFCLGVLAIWGILQWRLRRLAGKDIWIVPVWAVLWGAWAVLFTAAWLAADGVYQQELEVWLRRYPGAAWIDQHPALHIRRDERLAPLLLARRIVLAAGGAGGLGLLAGTVFYMRRKKVRVPLADLQK